MKQTKLFAFLAVCMMMLLTAKETMAQDKVFQLALVNPIQIVNANKSVTGLSISLLYGKNASVNGLNWGFVTHTASGTSTGIQASFVGYNESNFTGGQSGFVNVTKGSLEGVQWGVVNYAGSVSGLQIGLVNYAANMKKGLQIGLVNVIKQGGKFPIFPIVNWAL